MINRCIFLYFYDNITLHLLRIIFKNSSWVNELVSISDIIISNSSKSESSYGLCVIFFYGLTIFLVIF